MAQYERSLDKPLDQLTRATLLETVKYEHSASLSAWNLLGKRWTFLILTQLFASSQSFHELVKLTEGISEKVLAERLKELERVGLIRRQTYSGCHFRVRYYLTAKGEALEPVIKAIGNWSQLLS